MPFEALESDAVFDRVLYDGAEFGMQAHPGSEEEQDYLGIPGLLEPDQVQMLLQKRQARQIAHSRKKPDAEADLLELPAERRPVVTHKELLELRKQLNTLVGAYVHQSGKPHGVIHTELRRVCGGPPSAEATAGQLRRADQEGAGVGHPDAVSPPGGPWPAAVPVAARRPCSARVRGRRRAAPVPVTRGVGASAMTPG